jgi:glycosyltransferase involved in cell wall biosynthesis
LNRWTLKAQYHLCDQIFVHTDKMKRQLVDQFSLPAGAVTVIPYGINNAVPDTTLTPAAAKQRLGIGQAEKTILYFGAIGAYKGLEYLVSAFDRLLERDRAYRLVIAGKPKPGAAQYWRQIAARVAPHVTSGRVISQVRFIEDEETEVYFKAADVLVLPYRTIFQSGVLFLGYNFGLPVIATNVGALGEDIIEGQTGFLCEPEDASALAEAIERYFSSDLFKNLDSRRRDIKAFAETGHSWGTVAELTRNVYSSLVLSRAHV